MPTLDINYAKIEHRLCLGDTMTENDEPKDDPAKRLRRLVGSVSPMTRLPKKGDNLSFLPKQEREEKADTPPKPDFGTLRSAAQNKPASDPRPEPASASKNGVSLFGPRFWTFASILSLTVNAILVLVLITLFIGINRAGLSVSYLLNMGNNLLGGLYGNFEKMDRASIETNVEVSTKIPVQFDLQLNQQTNVVLSQDVTITNALVTVNTGGLNISRANTTIVLPEGTTLPVLLNLTVPVDTEVPVTLNVPVNIPLSETELHEPFVGLQEVVKPFYCMINPAAVNLDGQPVCR